MGNALPADLGHASLFLNALSITSRQVKGLREF